MGPLVLEQFKEKWKPGFPSGIALKQRVRAVQRFNRTLNLSKVPAGFRQKSLSFISGL